MRAILYFILQILLLLSLPFICLVRGAVFLYQEEQYGSWAAIVGATFITILIILIYIVFFYGRLTGRVGSMKRKLQLAILLVMAYGIHALFFFSETNAKHSEVQKEFESLHPILRLSISTIIHLDKNLIMTDANRQPEDYRKMGLPSKKSSLHYRQANGYVHALDIRTKNRSELRNGLLQLYFKAMGFNTLRHGGTADHLHVSLSNRDKPNII